MLTVLILSVLIANADTLAGQSAQVGVRHSQEHAEQGLPVNADAAQQADDDDDGKDHEPSTLKAQQDQQLLLDFEGVVNCMLDLYSL